MGEKTEKASPKKLRDARKKGQVAKSQDFPSACTFMVSILTTLHMMPYLYHQVGGFILKLFSTISNPNLLSNIAEFLQDSFLVILVTSLPIAMITAFTGVLVNFLIVGPLFSLESMKPDIKKLDPIQGIRNKFKMKTFVELLKQIFKITVAGYLIYTVMRDLIPLVIASPTRNIAMLLTIISIFIRDVTLKVGIFFIFVAVFDIVYQKSVFAKEMMMEKFEVKQEYKNSEGDPQIKGKRKEIAREIAYSAAPAAGVRLAKAVITNPAHLAIAFGYEESDPAPYILAKGKNFAADLIIKEAKKFDIPIMRNIDLAHNLFEYGQIFDFIPEDTFKPVAEILKWLEQLEADREM